MIQTEISKIHDDIQYPILMIHKDDVNRLDPIIVLQFNAYYGVVVAKNAEGGAKIGETVPIHQDGFIPFTGVLTLKNSF